MSWFYCVVMLLMENKILGVDDQQLELTVSLRNVTKKVTLDHHY